MGEYALNAILSLGSLPLYAVDNAIDWISGVSSSSSQSGTSNSNDPLGFEAAAQTLADSLPSETEVVLGVIAVIVVLVLIFLILAKAEAV